MNEPRLNFFTRIYYSIAGFGNYKYFLRQGAGKAVVYLLLLTLIIGVVSFIPVINTFNTVMDEVVKGFDSSVPDFTFSNGQLKVEGKMPVIIGEGNSTIIFDTSDSPDESILNNYDNVIMFTKDKMIQKTYANRRTQDLSAMQGITVTKESIRQALPMMKPVGIFILVFAALFFVIGKFISALIISLIGQIINSVKRTNLSYQSIFKISVFSMTLPLIVCTVFDLLQIPFMWIPFYLLAAVYVYGVIHSIRKELDSIGNDQMGPMGPME